MQPPTDSPAPSPTHQRVHRAGLVILAVGLLSAVVVYVLAISHPDPHPAPDFSGDRRFNFELERIGGKQAIYMAAINRWLASLWQGTNLAFTIGTLSVLAALFCFWFANLLSYPPADAADAPGAAPATPAPGQPQEHP